MITFRNTQLAQFVLLLTTSVMVASPQHEDSDNAVLQERISAVFEARACEG